MKIGGFIKQSLIDYPGKVAAVVFTQGCNFRCGYCHNPQLVLPELFQYNEQYSQDEILQYLAGRKYWLDGVVVTGGEPTIQNDLLDFLQELKSLGFQIKLDTNGSNPHVICDLIDRELVNYIAMDIKTIPECNEYKSIIGIENTSDILENVKKTISILQSSSIIVEFRTTKLPDIHNNHTIIQLQNIIGKGFLFRTNEYIPNKVLSSYL